MVECHHQLLFTWEFKELKHKTKFSLQFFVPTFQTLSFRSHSRLKSVRKICWINKDGRGGKTVSFQWKLMEILPPRMQNVKIHFTLWLVSIFKCVVFGAGNWVFGRKYFENFSHTSVINTRTLCNIVLSSSWKNKFNDDEIEAKLYIWIMKVSSKNIKIKFACRFRQKLGSMKYH